MANKTAREIVEGLVNRVAFDEKGIRDWNKLYNQALLSLCDLIIEGMDKDMKYNKNRSDACLSSCKESVRKSLGISKK